MKLRIVACVEIMVFEPINKESQRAPGLSLKGFPMDHSKPCFILMHEEVFSLPKLWSSLETPPAFTEVLGRFLKPPCRFVYFYDFKW